jgi:glycosyltransferase involved in cell wall biosynthesis
MNYILITAARNEEAFLELTIQSVVQQTVRPLRWVIVSDGSTDRTDEIAGRYAARHDWIEFVRMPERRERNFAGKAGCFNAAYERVRHLPFDLVGNLDADLTFVPDYYEYLLARFAADPKLGLGGTPFCEEGHTYDYRFSSTEHVSGAAQLFRRECFEEIGGYVPVKGGGIDVIAVLTARLKGWHTQTFTGRVCDHHRPMSSANYRSRFVANIKLGQRAYRMGFHPLWQIFRSVYQMTKRPYVTGGCALAIGYFWSLLCREPRPIGPDLVAFQRRDQMLRLRAFLKRLFGFHEPSPSVAVPSGHPPAALEPPLDGKAAIPVAPVAARNRIQPVSK